MNRLDRLRVFWSSSPPTERQEILQRLYRPFAVEGFTIGGRGLPEIAGLDLEDLPDSVREKLLESVSTEIPGPIFNYK